MITPHFEMQSVGFPSSKIMCILRGTNSISGYLKLELHPCNTVQARIGLHNISSMKYNLLLGVLGRLIRTARLWIVAGLLRANTSMPHQ
jgi:hypothetical protein